MLPAELADAVIKLGICYQLQVDGLKELLTGLSGMGMPPKEEDFTSMGYNKESEEDKVPEVHGTNGKVITDPVELLKYDGWHLSMKIPKEFPKTFNGPHYSAFINKRKFIVRGDDFPWTTSAIKHSFTLEYIKDVKLHNNVFLILTSFGQTGIVIN